MKDPLSTDPRLGEGFAFFCWGRLMRAAGKWPFYDGCYVCDRICAEEWKRMNP